MCLIVCKPRGLPLPDMLDMYYWFFEYPDGLGVSFQYQNKVRTIKGAMSESQMEDLFGNVHDILKEEGQTFEDVDLMMQFRAAVTGAATPKFCHPFPVSNKQADLDSLDVLSDVALAHNGVISMYNKRFNTKVTSADGKVTRWTSLGDKNDAQEYIKEYIVPLGRAIWNPVVQELIEDHTYSKFALLSGRGLSYIGTFFEEEGYFYSNMTYKWGYQSTYLQGGAGKIAYNKRTGLEVRSAPTSPWEGDDDDDDDSRFRELYPGYPYLPMKDVATGGLFCEFCGDYFPEVYLSPSDNFGTQLCASCYEQMEGTKPNEEFAVLGGFKND